MAIVINLSERSTSSAQINKTRNQDPESLVPLAQYFELIPGLLRKCQAFRESVDLLHGIFNSTCRLADMIEDKKTREQLQRQLRSIDLDLSAARLSDTRRIIDRLRKQQHRSLAL